MTGRQALWSVARLSLGNLPTPLHRLDRFSDAVGGEVWIKRDDIGAPALAGNKVRKLEYLLAEAVRLGADCIVTAGAVQSNSARTAAAAARSVGLDPVLVLLGDEPPDPGGNLLIDRILGAEVRFVGHVGWPRLDRIVEEVAAELERAGRVPFTAPIGCSSPRGVLGFAAAYFEALDQFDSEAIAPQRIYHASTSGGTHAGLVLGRALAGRGPVVRAISAGRVQQDPVEHHRSLALETSRLLGNDVEPVDVDVDFDHIGPGYGVPSEECLSAIRLMAETEGILCDPVYSGKGLAGLIADVRERSSGSPVVFWHTGGWQALFDPVIGRAVLD